jgi:hypothetical protein
VSLFVTVTVAPTTTAPDGSTTVPETLAVTPAKAMPWQQRILMSRKKAGR